jgi:hypothetical protein
MFKKLSVMLRFGDQRRQWSELQCLFDDRSRFKKLKDLGFPDSIRKVSTNS